MRMSSKQVAAEIYSRRAMQEAVRLKYGEKAIAKAKRRLCAKCEFRPCFLFPITTEGRDCPYFKQKEAEK